MALPPLGFIQQFIPVPTEFRSFLQNDLFERCLVCDRFLLNDGEQYIIEKAFRRSEVIFEYAMCLTCHEKLNEDFSSESTARLEAFFAKRTVDLAERRRKLLEDSSRNVGSWIDRCIVTGAARADCSEYQILAQCDGRDLLYTYLPFMISGEAIDEMMELLSPRTRDRLSGFIGEFLGIPPEFKSVPVV